MSCVSHKGDRLAKILALALFAASTSRALDFNTSQIADDSLINREPVISESGLAAWVAFDTNVAEGTQSDIVLWRNGARQNLTRDHAGEFTGNNKPFVDGDAVVWIANYSDVSEPHSWVLREVPDRDVGATELPALYRVTMQGDEQVFEPVAPPTSIIVRVTNELGEVVERFVQLPPEQQYRRLPSGVVEINFWPGTGEILRVTRDARHDFMPSFSGRLIAYQKEKGFPFGWEIMIWDDGANKQLTTNFFYDMAPKVHRRQVVWYGWDGSDYEIFLYDADRDATTQITSNLYDDVSPVLWDGQIAWEGYPAVESDIFLHRGGQTIKISDNIEDDVNPRIWSGQVVWQGFDGDDYEIYLFDGSRTIKVTANSFDDTHPEIRDNLVVWTGFEGNWDAEIYAWDLKGPIVRLTDNNEEDREPRTAGGRVIWSVERDGRYQIWLAEPR